MDVVWGEALRGDRRVAGTKRTRRSATLRDIGRCSERGGYRYVPVRHSGCPVFGPRRSCLNTGDGLRLAWVRAEATPALGTTRYRAALHSVPSFCPGHPAGSLSVALHLKRCPLQDRPARTAGQAPDQIGGEALRLDPSFAGINHIF